MADQTQKLVKVNGLGVIAFPDSMPDEKVAAAIKQFRSSPSPEKLKQQTHQTSGHVSGVTTEESEHARQLHQAAPLKSVLAPLEQAITPSEETSLGSRAINAVKGPAANVIAPALHPWETLKSALDTVKAMMPAYANTPFGPVPVPNQEMTKSSLEQAQTAIKYPAYSISQVVTPFLAGGAMEHLFNLKTTPLESTPTRANTRIVHTNPVGEVRMGTDNIPTVWMHPQAWEAYMKVAHPEEANPHAIAGENVALDPEFLKLATNPKLSEFQHGSNIQELLQKAHEASPNKSAVLAPRTGSLGATVRMLREEKIHAWQRSLAQNGDINNSLSPKAFDDLHAAVPKTMRDYLSQDYENASKPMFVSEAAARFIANDLHGTSPAEAVQFLDQYFKSVVDQHGPDALATLEHTRGLATHLKEMIDEEYRGADRTATQGNIRNVAEGRQGRAAPAISPTPAAEPAYSRAAPTIDQVKAEAEKRNPENWIKAGAEDFAKQFGRDINLPRYLTPDFRAQEIADAYEAMQHNPSDPKVAASYSALKRDIRHQWDYATQKMGIEFEPWKGEPGTQPYANSAEMTADVKNNHHLSFFRGGEMAADHPLAALDPETGFSSNDMLRAVHDLFGHAMESFQFGPRGEENAWNAHAQMFSPEALPALTSETKGQNSWVNFGPQMRDAQGNLLQPGQPGWLAPKERKFAEQKAGLLPERFHYRLDTPISFVSPNTFNINMERVGIRLGSTTHRIFSRISNNLAQRLNLRPVTNSAIGYWNGGAEDSVVQHFPMGANPDAVRYHSAVMARLANQNIWSAFFPSETGPDHMFAFHIEEGEATPEKIASVLSKNDIKDSTIEPNSEGGYTVWVSGKGDSVWPQFEKSAEQLGVHDVGDFEGTAESGGSHESREAASAEHTRRIEELERNHPEWRAAREDVESRSDYRTLHRLIRETENPFVEVTHGSTRPGLTEISPEKYGTGPQKGGEAARKKAYPQYWEPRSYFQIKGTRGERPYTTLPHQYQSVLNSENIYDVTRDPDNLKDIIPSNIPDDAGRFTALEKIIKENGYDGLYTPDGVVEVFKNTPAEAIIKKEGMFRRKQRTWDEIKGFLTKEELARHDTPEKQEKLMQAVNSMPDAEEWDAAVKAGSSGRLWYERSSRAFDALVQSQPEMFEPKDKDKFLNFVAALSPVQPVRQNLLMAINLWDKWNSAGRPMDVEWSDEKNFKEVKNKNAILFRILKGRGNTVGVDLPSRLYNGIRALQDQPMSGPKVSSFAPNLGKDVDRSTNDTWMAVFANVDPSAINKPHLYDAVSAMVREAGRKNGIPARQAQAAAWSFIKSLAEVSGWGKDRWRPPEEIIRKGLLTPELINQHAADFADMLANDEEIRARIKDIGGNLDALDKKLGKYVPARPAGESESATAILTRLLGAARRLEAARADAKIQSHLAAKSDEPSLFATEFSPEKMEPAFHRESPWYLKSEKVVADKMKGPMPADELHKMLTANGVKPDEMKWVGLDEFLRDKGKEKVTPDELKKFLDANNLQIQEVTKGGVQGWTQADNDRLDDLENRRNDLTDAEEAERDRLISQENRAGGQHNIPLTKFGSYTLPGGQNYREMLLTLPRTEAAVPAWKVIRPDGTVDMTFTTENSARSQARISGPAYTVRQEGTVNTDRGSHVFTSSHWDEPNVVGHVRFNNRTGPNGEKLLHLEELQSDWHQKGRTKGYQGELPNTNGWKATKTDDHPLSWTVDDADGSPIRVGGRDLFYGKTAEDAIAEAARTQQTGAGRESRVPDVPFKKTWPELLMKRMIRYASENGYDGISWTPGEEQAARYDLSKQIDSVKYAPTEGLLAAQKDGHNVIEKENVKPEDLPDLIGKEAARKLLETDTGSPLWKHHLAGQDLKIGGEGMKGFYDKIVPEMANKLGKQFGAKVGETKASVGTLSRNDRYGYNGPELSREDVSQIYKDVKEGRRDNPSLAEGTNFVNRSHLAPTLVQIAGEMGKGASYSEAVGAVLADNKNLLENYAKEMGGKIEQKKYQFKKVPYFPITDSMRKTVTEEGQPMFHRGALSTPEKNELLLLEDKRFKRTITPDEKKRYYELSDRDTAARHGLVLPPQQKQQLQDYRNTHDLIESLRAAAALRNPESGQPPQE